jgi:hypothetical protein
MISVAATDLLVLKKKWDYHDIGPAYRTVGIGEEAGRTEGESGDVKYQKGYVRSEKGRER